VMPRCSWENTSKCSSWTAHFVSSATDVTWNSVLNCGIVAFKGNIKHTVTGQQLFASV
jgi:hypothetical protein